MRTPKSLNIELLIYQFHVSFSGQNDNKEIDAD